MNAYVIATVIAVIVFILVLSAFFATRYLLKNRRKKNVYAPSFERADKGRITDTEQLRGSGALKDKKGKEGRGRFYAFGVLIAAVFGTLTVKLWSLQILSHDKYVAAANENMTSEVSIPANRGRILDRNGVELVGNRPSIVVSGKRSLADDKPLVHRLSLVLGIPKGVIRRNLLDNSQGVQSDHTIATDVSMKSVAYLKEHPSLFKDIKVESRTIRYYPYGSLAAHILGYIGPVTEDFLKSQTGDEQIPYQMGDSVGKDGAELTFEKILQGMHGTKTYKVDVDGNPTETISETEPVSGDDVALTIDAELQSATDKILAEVIVAAKGNNSPNANAGALICIDVEDGGILAASSFPTFFPSELAKGISFELWEGLNSKESGYPLTNRVVSGAYPAASTFKAFVSMAGLEHAIIEDQTEHSCTGFWDEYGEAWGQRCWIYPNGHGVLGLEGAIENSCDVFFYSVGAAFYERWSALSMTEEQPPNLFQDYLKSWGFGEITGVDIPGETKGRIPDQVWKEETFSDTPEDARWQPGDMASMSIGQGDMLVTPIQLCNGYTSIARKKIITPHLFHQVTDVEGNVVVSHEPDIPDKQPKFEEKHIARVIQGLKQVIGVYSAEFDPIPVELAGKSGTAEVAGKDDYSWYVAYAPVDNPKYCVACVIEQGGGGSSSAIVGVQHTFAKIYGIDLGPITTYKANGER